jgi:predicted O-methyltransferase YrrM
MPETEDLAVKAPNRHAKRLEMLGRMPKGGRCAEIGVWNGAFSQAILEVTQPRELILIDPWDLLTDKPGAELTHHKHTDSEFMGSMRDRVAARFADRPEVVLRQGFSAEVMATLDDDSLDWVYIDGNHLYDFVLADLKIAARKVRLGGMIAGDDFFWKRNERFHVREAVFDFLAAAGQPRKADRIGQQFMLPVTEAIKAYGARLAATG